MGTFSGTLNSNEIFSALYNMIISQQVFSDNISGTFGAIMEENRVDGTLYGDTKLYYSTDALQSAPWTNDSEASNLLTLHRPKAPAVQSIVMNQFRQIRLTVDHYLSKRAWGTEGSFSSFNSVMLGWIRDTKRIYDATLFNAFFGTRETNTGKQTQSITFANQIAGVDEDGNNALDLEATSRLHAQYIAQKLADILVEIEDPNRDYNDNGFLRSFGAEELTVVWNASIYNEITKLDLPTIFHKDGVMDKFTMKYLPERYFGTINTSGATLTGTNTTVRSLIEKDYTVGGTTTHVFPGDLLPNLATYLANETYTVDPTILFKVYKKGAIPFMSAFEVATVFSNPRSLTETHFLTYGHNTLEHLKNYPLVTVRGVYPT